MLNNMVHVNYM